MTSNYTCDVMFVCSRFSPSVPPSLTHGQVEAMLQSTIKDLQQKQAKSNKINDEGLLPTPTSIVIPPNQMPIVSSAVEKARKAAELQAKINSTLATKPDLLSSIATKLQTGNKPVPLVLDAEGKSDIPKNTRAPTLMANLRAQQRAQFKQINKETQKKDEKIDKNPYFDQRVSLQIAGRGKRQFKFNEPGGY
jgi:U4/U6 small nuclear ribonucleoprotein PRP3